MAEYRYNLNTGFGDEVGEDDEIMMLTDVESLIDDIESRVNDIIKYLEPSNSFLFSDIDDALSALKNLSSDLY